MCEWLSYWLVDCGSVWCARKRLGRGAGRGQRREAHSPFQQLENEGIHSRGLDENDMGRNSLE